MQTVRARDVMHAEIMSVRADMSAREAAGFLTHNEIAGAPVLDADGRVVGVLSLTDLAENEVERPDVAGTLEIRQQRVDADDLRFLHIESDDILVSDIMTPTIYTVPDDTPVAAIAQAMIAGRIHRLFVTREQHLVGIVTPLDLLQLLTAEKPRPEPARRRAARRRK